MSLKKYTALFALMCLLLCVLPLTAAAAETTAGDVKAMVAQLPNLDTLKAMTLEQQQEVYAQTQAAYDAYQALSDEEKAGVEGAEDVFQALFDHFNSLVMPLEEAAAQEEPAKEKKEGLPWGVTAFILALITTFLQNKFIHDRKR